MSDIMAELAKLEGEPVLAAIGAAIAAMAGLGIAAMGLVDASKALWGGVANIGFGHVERGCAPFANVLRRGAGQEDWAEVLRAQWRNGRDKEAQKALVRALVRLGLTEGAVEELSTLANVQPERLADLSRRLRAGEELGPEEVNALGRVDAIIGMRIDAAFERGDQQYRNVARLAAALVAIALALLAATASGGASRADVWIAFLVGLLSVPIAPLAKDLISSLSAATTAVKAARGL